jgi:hypothetical protein
MRWHSVSHWIHLDSCANEIIDKRKNESKEGLLIQKYICPGIHLPRWTFAHKTAAQNLGQKTFAQKDICPERHLPRRTFAQKTFDQKDIYQERHLPRKTFTHKDICPEDE